MPRPPAPLFKQPLSSTGEARVDEILLGAIGVLEACFPGRIGGYYLAGSYADGSYVAASDIDLVPIFRGRISVAEEARYRQLLAGLDQISPIHLGFGLRDEDRSFVEGGIGIKIGSVLLYGEDVRPRIPLWPLDQYKRFSITGCCERLAAFCGGPPRLPYPVTYPAPDMEFFGYVRDETHGDGYHGPGTARLFGHLMVCASTVVTLQTDRYNASKSYSARLYAQYIGDEWSEFLTEIYEQCKRRWGYRVPEDPAERAQLHVLCRQVPDFENRFLVACREYVAGTAAWLGRSGACVGQGAGAALQQLRGR